MSQRILLLSLLILLICACGAGPQGTSAPLPTVTPTFSIPHEPGVADLWHNRPPAGELVEVDAYFSGAMPSSMFGGSRPPLPDQVACPTMWNSALTDQPFLPALRLLNGAHSNTLADDVAWLIATIPEATEPGKRVGGDFPYHARFRGRLGEPAFADCLHAERIFVVEEVVIIYEQQPQEQPADQLDLPDGYDNWLRYHDAALAYSVPYPPDWTVEPLSEAELLGAVALHAPQWPDYPIIVRVSSGEIDVVEYHPVTIPPNLQKLERGGGMFRQGSGFGIGQSMPDSQMLSGYSQYWETSPDKQGAAVLFSANGRTYQLSLEYPIGFEASQSLLTHFSTIVESFQFDVPPSPSQTLPQAAPQPSLTPNITKTAVPVMPTPTESIKSKAPRVADTLPRDQTWIWSVEGLPTPPECTNSRGRVMAVDEDGELTQLPYWVIHVIERAKQSPLLMVCLESESWGLVDTLSWRETPLHLHLAGAYGGGVPHKLDSKWRVASSNAVLSPDGTEVAFQMYPFPFGEDDVGLGMQVWVADVETGQIRKPFDHQPPNFQLGDD